MSFQIADQDVTLVISALRTAAECYLRDAIAVRHDRRDSMLSRQFIRQQDQALRIADELEAGAPMPMMLRRQAD